MNSVLHRAALGLLVASCATTEPDADSKHVTNFVLDAYGAHEECATLAPGDRVEYTFTSDADVSFNIHYHEANAVVEPITREHVRDDAGVFLPAIAQDYCLMWEAGASTATLEYRLRIRRAR